MNIIRNFIQRHKGLAVVAGVLGMTFGASAPALAAAGDPVTSTDVVTSATSAVTANAPLVAGIVVGAIALYALYHLAWSGFKVVGKVIRSIG